MLTIELSEENLNQILRDAFPQIAALRNSKHYFKNYTSEEIINYTLNELILNS
jgi:hypothetical protein